jgi:glucokinase
MVTDLDGHELARRATSVDQQNRDGLVQIDEREWRYDRVAQQVAELMEEVLADARRPCADARRPCAEVGIDRSQLAAIGIGSAGPFEGGGIVGSTNIKPEGVPVGHLVRIPLVDPVAKAFGVPTVLLNDCSAGVLGDVVFGVGKGRNRSELDIVYITLSTGFGGGAYSRGHLLSGKDGNAAEVGHFCVVANGLKCGCGSYGCAEAYGSGSGVAKNARMQLLNENFDSQMVELARKAAEEDGGERERLTKFCLLGYVDAGVVFEADRLGDALATRVVEEAIRCVGLACSHIANAYDPEIISLGGSLGLANADRIIPGIAEEMKKHLNVAPPEILPTSLGHDVVLWGAIAAAMEAAGSAS